MLDAFNGALNAQGIVAMALRRAGSPDLHLTAAGVEDLTAPAYMELQQILDHLALVWDWPWSRIPCKVILDSRCVDLPSIFWRVAHDDPFWITAPGERYRVPLNFGGDFFGKMQADTYGPPERIHINKIQGNLYVDPIPDQTYEGELHLQPWHVPLTEITSIPWFPYSSHLVSALAIRLNLQQDDNRADKEAVLEQQLFKQIRHSISDQGERSATITLNPEIYRPVRSL